jgi:flagellar basal body-associated protein FliL
VLAAYTALVKPDAKERNKMFGGMFIISIIGVLFVSLLALMGVFNLVLPS